MKTPHKLAVLLIIVLILVSSLGMGWLGGALAKTNAVGAVPSVVSYQGYLSTSGGLPYNGSADFTFSIYDAEAGGAQLWTEAQAGVTVVNGFFSVLLGSANPLTASVFSATTHYLETQVDTGAGAVTLPRQALASVPFALHAEYADAATYADSAGIVDWSGLTNLPAGFSDGIDDTGLTSLPPTFSRSAPDYIGTVGSSTSIAIGVDGLALISHVDWKNNDLRITHCTNINCTQADSYILDSVNFVIDINTSLAIGTDGQGLISYSDWVSGDLKVAHCNDIPCTSASLYTLDTGTWGQHSSLAIGADGLGLISYYDTINANLKTAHCVDTACSSAAIVTLDSAGDVGAFTSIAIGADNLGLISYYDSSNGDLKVAHCYDTACSGANTYTMDSAGSVGLYTSIAIGTDGLGLISYQDYTLDDLKVAHCDNTACSSASSSNLDSAGSVGSYTSITIGSDGVGLISYFDSTNGNLKITHCGDLTCSSPTRYTLDNATDSSVGYYTSITIGADGMALISYYDHKNSNLKVVHCDDYLCTP